ncbi:MAG: RES family NAD+ phosphorylase [Treponema sp.]|nr:RES family NAD+ phosphorylase [Treponema sp.]
MLSGKGSWKDGARYNTPRSYPVVYPAAAPDTALAEYPENRKEAGIPVNRDRLPCVLAAVEVFVKKLADLADTTAAYTVQVCRCVQSQASSVYASSLLLCRMQNSAVHVGSLPLSLS